MFSYFLQRAIDSAMAMHVPLDVSLIVVGIIVKHHRASSVVIVAASRQPSPPFYA